MFNPLPAIESLFPTRRPPTIAWLVSFVVVDAVQAIGAALAVQTWWALAHIGEEILEFEPPLGDRDAASSVILKPFVFRVPAAVQHAAPDIINLGLAAKVFAVVSGHRRDDSGRVWKFNDA